MPNTHIDWLAISYTVPATPSRARVYVWRHLRALHAESVNPGLFVLPDSEENRIAFHKIAEEARSFGGDAVIMRFDFVDGDDEKAIRARFSAAAREEEKELLERFESLSYRLSSAEGGVKRAAVRELRGALDRFGKSPLRAFANRESGGEMAKAAEEMIGTLRSLSGEVSSLIRIFKNNLPSSRRNDDV